MAESRLPAPPAASLEKLPRPPSGAAPPSRARPARPQEPRSRPPSPARPSRSPSTTRANAAAPGARGRRDRPVRLSDLRGDLHTHTTATDGTASIETMAEAARRRGLRYIAITDHTRRTAIARGLSATQMRVHLRRIDAAQDEVPGITLLRGAEVDILRTGLDLPDDVLEELDIVVCSLHHRDRQAGPELTRRVLQAMEHPKAQILGHPTGRLLGRRAPMDLDWDRVLGHAVDHGWALEVNGQADRLDPPAEILRKAVALGVRFALNSDAHSVKELRFLENAAWHAQRGGVPARQVLNAANLQQLRAELGK